MPQKHAKNNCASKVFNHWERNEAATEGSYGTVKVRLSMMQSIILINLILAARQSPRVWDAGENLSWCSAFEV